LQEKKAMPIYQGLVTRILNQDRAEIAIAPGEQQIHDAPEVSKKVCHACTGGSTVRLEVINRAGAEAGDWVLLIRSAAAIKENVKALFGIPSLSVVLGAGAGWVLTMALGLHAAIAMVGVALGLLVGLFIGVRRYRRVSAHNPLIITRIVKKRAELAAMAQEKPDASPGGESLGGPCAGCRGH
jgi:hypothetical protein